MLNKKLKENIKLFRNNIMALYIHFKQCLN